MSDKLCFDLVDAAYILACKAKAGTYELPRSARQWLDDVTAQLAILERSYAAIQARKK